MRKFIIEPSSSMLTFQYARDDFNIRAEPLAELTYA